MHTFEIHIAAILGCSVQRALSQVFTHKRFPCVVLFACFQAGPLYGFDDSSWRQIQVECEKYREDHFHQGDFTFRIVELIDDGDGGVLTGSEIKLRSWFDGECLRTDNLSSTKPSQAAVCEGKYIWSVGDASVTVAPTGEYEDPISQFGLTHPRWIGMGFNSIETTSQGADFRCLVLDSRYYEEPPIAVEELVDGVEAWKLSFSKEGVIPSEIAATLGVEDDSPDSSQNGDQPFRTDLTLWIAPSQGYALLKAMRKTVYSNAGIEVNDNLDVKFEKDEESEVWYPSKVTYLSRKNGSVFSGYQLNTELASFSQPDRDVFGISGFNLGVGRRINDRTKGSIQKSFIWDGKKTVEIPSALDLQSVDLKPQAKDSTWFWLLIFNAIAMLTIGGILLIRSFKHTTSK